MKKTLRCMRCRRRWRGTGEWNSVWTQGVPVGLLCPDCQTPEENVEAEINAAGIDYSRAVLGSDGRVRAPQKGVL